MYSVDLAAIQTLEPLGIKPSLYRIHVNRRKLPYYVADTRLRYLRWAKWLGRFDTVAYWGDFVTSPLYAVDTYRRYEAYAGRSRDPARALESWKAFCLLKGIRHKDMRVLSISQNMQSAVSTLKTLSAAQQTEISQLYRENFDAIWPRDPVSTKEAKELLIGTSGSSPQPEVTCGVDAAFLVTDHLLGRLDSSLEPGKYFAYFFHRSAFKGLEGMLASVASATGLTPVPLSKWLNLDMRNGKRDYSEMTTLIENSAFVLSDTYHCCINAMTIRKPVIGLGRDATSQITTISDFKKKVLFEMFGLAERSYVSVPADSQALPQDSVDAIVHAARYHATGDLPIDHYALVEQKTEAHRSRIMAELKSR